MKLPFSAGLFDQFGRDRRDYDNRCRHSCIVALITIVFEVYSDAGLTSVSQIARPDPATLAIAHGLKRD